MVKLQDDRPLYSLLLQVANPALIIAMVGSLIFFLIEIFYRGPHVLRLNLIMALFTMATVLISRISIEAGKERAAMFAAGLGLATLATTSVVVDFEYENLAMLEPAVIIFLIVTVMWVSNRLVWDCTLLGKSRDVSAMGLLEAIRQKFVPSERFAGAGKRNFRGAKGDNGKSIAAESFSVFEFMLGRNGKNTTPGLWVFYLAIAAFPIFGAGQWFVNTNSSGFSVFFLFAVYLTSGLGLLMVTSLLGLKRYVNKRGITIPDPVAMNWLFVGTMFLIGLMLIISLLPRPDLSSTMNDYLVLLSHEKKTSELAVGDDNEIPDEPEGNENAKPKQGGDQPPPEDAPVADGKRGDETDSNSSEKKDGGGGEKSDSKSDKGKGDDSKNGESKNGKGEKSEKGNDGGKDDGGKDDGGRESEAKDDSGKDKDNAEADADQPQGKPQPEKELEKEPGDQPNNAANQQRPAAPPPPSFKPDPNSFRWIVYALVALIFGAIIIMYRDELLKMWQQLFGVKKPETESETENASQSERLPTRPKPFSSFSDPFASGMAGKVSPEKLMEYSSEAMRAWANERGIDVSGHFTADDLVAAIESSIGKSHSDFRSFAVIFNQTIYGDHPPSAADLQTIGKTWRFMKTNLTAARSPTQTSSAVGS